MADPAPKILLVSSEPETIEKLVHALCSRLDAQITCVADAETALDTDMFEPHDLVIVDMELDDGSGLDLSEHLLVLRARPVILMTGPIDADEAVEALRTGIKDIFIKPFEVDELASAAERVVRGYQLHIRHGARYRKMRDLVRHVIKERRDLNQRIDLICRDLVDAQRRLVHRVLAVEQRQADDDA